MNEFRVLADDNTWRYYVTECRADQMIMAPRDEKEEKEFCPGVKPSKDTVGRNTFVRDKDKKEIYEGDIVAVKHVKGEVENYIIQWGVNSLSWELLPANRVVPYSDDYISDLGSYASEGDVLKHFKIIGNIHQNPELLEEKESPTLTDSASPLGQWAMHNRIFQEKIQEILEDGEKRMEETK